MFSNLILVLAIIAEIIGISPPKLADNLLNSQNQVAGIKSLPKVNIAEISPEPVQKNSPELNLQAKAAAAIDLKTNKILYQKNIHQQFPIASITKMMTAVVMVEDFDLNNTVTVSSAAAFEIGSKMRLLNGEQISARELVKGMLIRSANDAARALEEHFGKDKVVVKMNETAEFLKMKDSKFTDATGLDSGNISSSADLMILSRYSLKYDLIREAIKTPEYTVPSADGSLQHLIRTTNRLLKNYPDIFGVKTGYTEEAGNCLIAGAENNDRQILTVVLGEENGDVRFTESRTLLDWSFQNYQW